MGKRSRKRDGGGTRFVMLHMYLLRSTAWKQLSHGAKVAYVELKSLYNGTNNGQIGFGSRGAAEVLRVSKSTAARYLNELEFYGFIVRAKDSSFAQKKNTIEWLLTEARNDITGELPLRTFAKWRPDPTSVLVPSTGLKDNASNYPNDFLSVPVIEPSVPPSGHNEGMADIVDGNSSSSGTVEDFQGGAQSHEGDTYRCKPEGEEVLGWTQGGVAHEVRVYLEKLPEKAADHESSTPYAIRISEDIWETLNSDPFLRVIGETFPGAVVVLQHSDFEESRRKLGLELVNAVDPA